MSEDNMDDAFQLPLLLIIPRQDGTNNIRTYVKNTNFYNIYIYMYVYIICDVTTHEYT